MMHYVRADAEHPSSCLIPRSQPTKAFICTLGSSSKSSSPELPSCSGRWSLVQALTTAFGSIPSAFANLSAKKLSEILFLQPKRSQLHTIACSEVWRGTQKLWILTTRIITFGLLLKQRKSPGDSWRRIAMGSCHRGQHSNICQFLLFALLAHSKRCSEDQSLQTGCFPPKGKPTGLIPRLNLSQVVVSGDAGGKFGRVLVLS